MNLTAMTGVKPFMYNMQRSGEMQVVHVWGANELSRHAPGEVRAVRSHFARPHHDRVSFFLGCTTRRHSAP